MITTMHSDQNASPPRVEVITSVQRRRRWPTAEKIRLVEETMQAGMSVSYVARPVVMVRSCVCCLLSMPAIARLWAGWPPPPASPARWCAT